MSHSKSKHGCTVQELNEWFKAKFEKLGCMVIANEHGHDIKISAYLQSISHLQECIKDKIEIIHDPDSKVDLKIMLKKTEILSIAANKLLDSKLSDSSKHKKHYHNEKNDATFYGLHKWETSMFEKLGWMVLAKNEGNNLKIKSYMYSIHYLKSMIMKKMEEVHEKDHKDDLKILYDQACILSRAAIKILGKSDLMSSKSKMQNEVIYNKEAPHSMLIKIDKTGEKYLSYQSSFSKHNKHKHTKQHKTSSKSKMQKGVGLEGIEGIVHSNEASPSMVKYLTSQTSKSIAKHNKPSHTRKSRNASKNKSSGSIFGGIF